jgi:hypothetical protein
VVFESSGFKESHDFLKFGTTYRKATIFSYPSTNIKLKFALEQATKAQWRGGGVLCSSTLSLASALGKSCWSTPRFGHFNPGRDQVPIV